MSRKSTKLVSVTANGPINENRLIQDLLRSGVIQSSQKKKKKRVRKPRKDNITNIGPRIGAPISTTRETRAMKRKNIYSTGHQMEFVMTLMGSTGNFEVKSTVAANAGNPSFSPWLAGHARLYESYRFKYLKVHFIARCPTTTAGWVAISPDCNPHDPPPDSEIAAFQNKNTVSQAPYKDFCIVFDKEMLSKRKTYFCRKDGALPDGADKDLYDIGNINIICGGNATGSPVGQIWVEYDCEFHTPEYAPSVNSTFLMNNQTGVTSANPLGTVSGAVIQQIGDVAELSSGTTLTFKKAFHGFLSQKFNGSGLTGLPSIAGGTSQYNLSEGAFNMSGAATATNGLYASLNTLMRAVSGETIILGGPTGTINAVNLALSPCLL